MKKKIILSALLIALIIAVCCILIFGIFLPKKRDEEKKAEQQRIVQAYRDNKFAAYEEENAKYADYEVEVAFIGDSLTDGCNLEAYYPDFITANRGIGGDTTYDLQNRMQLSVYDLKPKVIVMLIGGNNLDTMLENYENILIGMQDNLPNTKVILVSLSAMGGDLVSKNQLAAYNNVTIKKLAEKYNYAYVDIFTPLFNEKTGEIYSEYTNDGAHFTNEGYLVVSNAITPAIKEALNK